MFYEIIVARNDRETMTSFKNAMLTAIGEPAHQHKPKTPRPPRRTFKSLHQEIAKLKAERDMLLDIVKHAAKI